MEGKVLLRKFIQDKTMQYNEFRRLYLKDSSNNTSTDYERGYIAGICHALNEVNRDLTQDNVDIESIIHSKIGTGLRWCRKK